MAKRWKKPEEWHTVTDDEYAHHRHVERARQKSIADVSYCEHMVRAENARYPGSAHREGTDNPHLHRKAGKGEGFLLGVLKFFTGY